MERNGYVYFLHCIRDSSGSLEKAQTIMKKGLVLANGHKTLLSTAICVGDYEKDKEMYDYVMGYRFGIFSEGYRILLKVPSIITNSNGESLYLGEPKVNLNTSGQEYVSTNLFLDAISAKNGVAPAGFVYGYLTPDNQLVLNPDFYENMSTEERDRFFDTLKASLDNILSDLSGMMARKDINGIRHLRELIVIYFKDDTIISEIDEYLSKYEEKELEDDTPDSSLRQIKELKMRIENDSQDEV